MAQAHRLLLADADQAHHLADAADLVEKILLVLALERVFQLVAAVEVILDGGLAPAVHHHHLLGAGPDRFLDDQLDGGHVHDRQHLLGHRLGGRQKARAQTGGRDHDLAQGMVHRGAKRSIRV